ncbi:hypothetical protein C8J57DRAFT_1481045 [Mycena rebaudengoi]|nr:hypothetical protein C8J57DRAFT_1481045 [Mycena rebaudengoi]
MHYSIANGIQNCWNPSLSLADPSRRRHASRTSRLNPTAFHGSAAHSRLVSMTPHALGRRSVGCCQSPAHVSPRHPHHEGLPARTIPTRPRHASRLTFTAIRTSPAYCRFPASRSCATYKVILVRSVLGPPWGRARRIVRGHGCHTRFSGGCAPIIRRAGGASRPRQLVGWAGYRRRGTRASGLSEVSECVGRHVRVSFAPGPGAAHPERRASAKRRVVWCGVRGAGGARARLLPRRGSSAPAAVCTSRFDGERASYDSQNAGARFCVDSLAAARGAGCRVRCSPVALGAAAVEVAAE